MKTNLLRLASMRGATVKAIAVGTTVVAMAMMSARADTIYVSNYGDSTISKITSDGVATKFASVDERPFGLVFSHTGNLYVVSSQFTNKITVLNRTGGVASSITLPRAFDATALAWKNNSVLYMASQGGYGIRRNAGPNPAPVAAGFTLPFGLAFDREGTLFASDAGNGRISKIAADGSVTVFASNVNNCYGLAFDAAGNLYAASESKIVKFAPNGERTNFASGFVFPMGIAFDTAGDLYVADQSAGAMKRVTPDGVVHPFASGLAMPIYVAVEPKLEAPTLTMTTPDTVTLAGDINVVYTISVSADLVNWTALSTQAVIGGSSFQVTDPNAAFSANRFYKARRF